MERNWKNFKLDPDKVYKRIGQVVVYISFNLLLSAFGYWAFLQRNDLLGGKHMKEFIINYVGFIVGFFTIPTIKLIIKMFQRTFKSTKHKKIAKKVKNNK